MDQFLEELRINTGLARRVLVKFIHDEITRAGFSRVVLGLSGGVDSSLSACLAVEALGPHNVLGISMPHRTSSDASLEHALLVIEDLGIQHRTVDITPMTGPIFEQFPDMGNVRRGNIMARQRMLILYDQSVAFGGLVVGTSNKTETLLGYTTLFGDNAAAIQPLGDLYKYQVRQLAAAMGVPDVIINKPPSADLWQGQTDEDELGFTYNDVDQLLYLLVDQRYSLDEAVDAGFERAFVTRVWHIVQRSQYKRRMPPVPKLSQRTVNHDFLYLRDWGT